MNDETEPIPPDEMPANTPPQFGTRTLFYLMLGASLIFALAKWVGVMWAVGVSWLVLLVAVHVLANSWGRKHFQPEKLAEKPAGAEPEAQRRQALEQIQHETAQRLNDIHIGKVRLYYTLGGGTLGFLLGAGIVVLFLKQWNSMAVNSLVIASISGSVLGSFVGYWVSSFVVVFHGYYSAGLEGEQSAQSPLSVLAEKRRKQHALDTPEPPKQ